MRDGLYFKLKKTKKNNYFFKNRWGAVRSPRPFIMLKFIRSIIRFKLPRNRIQMIIK